LTVHPEQVAAARALKPMHERQVFGRSIMLFDAVANQKVDGQQLAGLSADPGDVRTPSIADLFVAILGDVPGDKPGNLAGEALGNYEGAAR
jgi:ABC-2 type transport system ATP-binding protein